MTPAEILSNLLRRYGLQSEYNAAPDRKQFARDLIGRELSRNNALLCDMLDTPDALARCGYAIDQEPELTPAELDLIRRLPCGDVLGVRRIDAAAR
jgi:hypothetical protein